MSSRREWVFLVRMWHEAGDSGQGSWRGSVYEVKTGRRCYLSAPAEVVDFIASALRSSEAKASDATADTSD